MIRPLSRIRSRETLDPENIFNLAKRSLHKFEFFALNINFGNEIRLTDCEEIFHRYIDLNTISQKNITTL